jgi:hypothetical protein
MRQQGQGQIGWAGRLVMQLVMWLVMWLVMHLLTRVPPTRVPGRRSFRVDARARSTGLTEALLGLELVAHAVDGGDPAGVLGVVL